MWGRAWYVWLATVFWGARLGLALLVHTVEDRKNARYERFVKLGFWQLRQRWTAPRWHIGQHLRTLADATPTAAENLTLGRGFLQSADVSIQSNKPFLLRRPFRVRQQLRGISHGVDTADVDLKDKATISGGAATESITTAAPHRFWRTQAGAERTACPVGAPSATNAETAATTAAATVARPRSPIPSRPWTRLVRSVPQLYTRYDEMAPRS